MQPGHDGSFCTRDVDTLRKEKKMTEQATFQDTITLHTHPKATTSSIRSFMLVSLCTMSRFESLKRWPFYVVNVCKGNATALVCVFADICSCLLTLYYWFLVRFYCQMEQLKKTLSDFTHASMPICHCASSHANRFTAIRDDQNIRTFYSQSQHGESCTMNRKPVRLCTLKIKHQWSTCVAWNSFQPWEWGMTV